MTWRPTAENGWYPHLSPDGTHVLYGFWRCGLANLVTGDETEVLGPVAADGHRPRFHPLGWRSNREFIAVTEPEPGVIAALYVVPLDTLLPVDQHVTGFDGVSFGNAAHGHWAVYVARRGGVNPWCVKDGKPFHQELRQYGCDVNGDHLVTADMDANYELMHFAGDRLVRRLNSPQPIGHVNENGDVTTGYYGPAWLYPWNESGEDCTITPWRLEGPPVPVRVGADLWLWTSTEEYGSIPRVPVEDHCGFSEGLMLGRRRGERDPIVLTNFASVAYDAVWTGAEWVVAGNDVKGHLQVRWVPMDAPRQRLEMPLFTPFRHSVLIAPFKDPAGASGVPGLEAEEIGIYVEKPSEYATVLATAEARRTRVLIGHDSPAPWTLPLWLRPWDVPLVELYRLTNETLAASMARWRGSVVKLLADWPGDCGLIPMFYCQSDEDPTDPRGWSERWTVQEVLDGLSSLSALVNLSPRIKLVAPFAWDRANGIIAHPELRAAFGALLRATPGRPTFIPIEELMTKPTITVKDYDRTLERGKPWHVSARIGDTDITVRIGGDGNLTLVASNAAGSDATGRPRPVEIIGGQS